MANKQRQPNEQRQKPKRNINFKQGQINLAGNTTRKCSTLRFLNVPKEIKTTKFTFTQFSKLIFVYQISI